MYIVAAKARGSHLRVHFKVHVISIDFLTQNITVCFCGLLYMML